MYSPENISNMDPKQKTMLLLGVMNKRSTIAPYVKPVDARLKPVHHVPWGHLFSSFNREHAKAAAKLVNILLDAYNFSDFVDLLEDCRTIENDRLFLYAMYSSVLHRSDCQGVILPPIEECAPHWYFAAETIHEAIQQSIHFPDQDHTVVNQRTAEAIEPESKLAYFREDVGLNIHHWSFHVVFPVQWNATTTGIVKDRKGEIFYYMHQQMLARYENERMSNGMSRVVPLLNFRQQKLLGYFPHMTSQVTGVHFGSRPEGMKLRDMPNAPVQDLEIWTLRILAAIDQGFVRSANGTEIPLNNEKGIDILGAAIEASSDSVNREFYGDLHNTGHVIIAAIHDPDLRFRGQAGVMNFIESSPRDPIFYQWHSFINSLFVRHKDMLTPYTRQELSLDGVKIISAQIIARESNVIETFMRENYSNLSHAPFLRTKKTILVRYQHLDHTPFRYIFNIENSSMQPKQVTVRVFMGPKSDETGTLLSVNVQRTFMIELDKFHKQLEPGLNFFTRNVSDSSVTIPRQRRFYRDLLEGSFENVVDYCTCGWPEHLLIPKGTPSGMEFSLFVMCTDYNEDRPDDLPRINVCTDAISYCGSKDQKYPDKKPMGFPFDRPIAETTTNMGQFLTSNMILSDIKVKHLGFAQPVFE